MFEDSENFDFARVTSIRIFFDGNEDGSAIINNIGYWK